MIALIAAMTINVAQAQGAVARFKTWCERWVIADHPYQALVKRLDTMDLVEEFRTEGGKRYWKSFDTDEYEMALAEMIRRYQHDHLAPAEREAMFQAFMDYPDVRARVR